jgi:hypothetical protein
MASLVEKHQQREERGANMKVELFNQRQERQGLAQQQQQDGIMITLVNSDRENDYASAQRAATEAIQIGRETLDVTIRQGEQLRNAERIADETEYKLEKANRVLRGMTSWSGWIANKLSRDVEPPEYKQQPPPTGNSSTVLGPPKVYEHVPNTCGKAAQSLQNYHANLQVLEDCETPEQRETCTLICNNMYLQAVKEIDTVVQVGRTTTTNNSHVTTTSNKQQQQVIQNFISRLRDDLENLRNRQLVLQQLHRGMSMTTEGGVGVVKADHNRTELLGDAKGTVGNNKSNSNTPSSASASSPIDFVTAQQDEHLDSMAKHLNELGTLASHLNTSLASHTDTLESLDEKNDSMLYKTKMVTRRADRLIQNKSWVQEKAEFVMYATIQHTSSNKYLSVAPNNDSTVVLSTILNERCVFGIWKRKRLLGFQNQYNKRWIGQSLLLSQLTCSATTFGRREEWDIDNNVDDTNNWSTHPTTLLISSAGWGAGAYLLLDRNGDGTLPLIGGGGLDDKKLAPTWSIQEFHKK